MGAVLLTVLSGETTWMLSVFSCETSFPMPLGQWLVGVVHIFIEVASHVVAYDHCGDPMKTLLMSTTFKCPFVGLPHLATCAGCFAIVLDVGAAFHVHKLQLSFRRVATPSGMCRLLCLRPCRSRTLRPCRSRMRCQCKDVPRSDVCRFVPRLGNPEHSRSARPRGT